MPSHVGTTAKTVNLGHIQRYIQYDMGLTDCYLKDNIKSPTPMINNMTAQLVHAGGKRIRPMLALLTAKLHHYQGKQHATLAATIELLHSATLLHDDVVDQSDKRRGRNTAHRQWGNKATILVGDFLYARCFDMLASIDDMAIMRVFAHTSSAIAKGEILQLSHTGIDQTSTDTYLTIIEHKTAHLFMAACESAALLSNASSAAVQAAKDFGMAFGMAYQLIDDCLDYSPSPATLDKNAGDDLLDGKCTLPVLYAYHNSTPSMQQALRTALTSQDIQQLGTVQNILQQCQAINHCQKLAQQYSRKALLALQTHQQHDSYPMLAGLVQFNLERCH